ncbi:hypothetical protein [Companilactobacillus jidongensis]|uniref:hypothetical protein n=1 Tax=Companilactobacillus jidongensis TaxID=2486006 RepID=UPI000F780C53|nr:hypothetical protein [Companilactobacillus jidongensis]
MNKKLIGSLAMAGFAAISLSAVSNLTDVSAAGVATTGNEIVRIYSPDGALVKNRALGPNTPWRVGKTKTINGVSMYQVATSEYVKSSEVTYDANAGKVNTNSNNSNVILTTDRAGSIGYNDNDGTVVHDSAYRGGQPLIGSFKVSKIVRNDFGTFYRVASHTWINGNLDGTAKEGVSTVTGDQSNIQYDKNFSPVGNTVLGKSASDIRTMLVNDYKCNPSGLAQISDPLLLTTYAQAVEFLDQGDEGCVDILNDINPNVGGIFHGIPM